MYSYNDKLYLFNHLSKITDKNHIRDIIKIISFKNDKFIFEQDNGTYIKFNELTDITKERFNNLEALPGLKCDGSLTLGENIADYGGLKIAYYACKNNMKPNICTTKIWEHKFFLSYANNWSEITTDEAIRNLVANNEHTINRLRVNGTLPMFTPWIDYYNVKKTNKLYLDIDKRAKVW